MKKIFIIIVMVLLTTTAFGQHLSSNWTSEDGQYMGREYTTFYDSYTKEEKDILILKDPNCKYSIQLDMDPMEKPTYNYGGILISDKQHQNFLSTLAKVQTKYEELIKTAKQNKTKKLYKPLPYKVKVGTWYNFCTEYSYNNVFVDLSFTFKVVNGNQFLLVVNTGNIREEDEDSGCVLDFKGFKWVFTNPDEIETLINLISIENVNRFRNKNKM